MSEFVFINLCFPKKKKINKQNNDRTKLKMTNSSNFLDDIKIPSSNKQTGRIMNSNFFFIPNFFSIRVFFRRHWRFTGEQEKGGDHLYSTISFPPAHKHSEVYLQLCKWDDYRVFLITPLRFTFIFNYRTATRWDLPSQKIITWLIGDGILSFVCLLDDVILVFITSIWHRKLVDLDLHRLSTLYYKQTN